MFATPSAWVVMVIASSAYGVVLSKSSLLSTGHMLLTFVVFGAVTLVARSPDLLLAVTVYCGLCDVLWRETSARGPYEAAKYLLVIGFTVLAVRFVRRAQLSPFAFALVALLVPGAMVGVWRLGPLVAREYLVAYLAGLVAIAAALWGCGNLRLSTTEVRGLYTIALSPIVAVTAVATSSTLGAGQIEFSDDVSFVASGGFGPNQVSSVVCFGALLCLLVVLQPKVGASTRILAMVTAVWLVGQGILTFSRGGLFGLVLAIGSIVLAAMTSAGHRSRALSFAVVVVVLATFILSWAASFTGGSSEKRFSSVDSTNRVAIAGDDVRLFFQHPILGVGVGLSKTERATWSGVAPHTEYTRLLAEHGLFGVGVILVLAAASIRLVRRAAGWGRMATTALIVMSLSQMVHSATRIGSIAVAFALASLIVDGSTRQPVGEPAH